VTKKILLGIDTGGTFTDFVCIPGDQSAWRVHKVLSTPDQPQKAILQGIRDLGLMDSVESGNVDLIHGTTVATNATLEGKGVRTVYIANHGLKDVILIGRQVRPELYNLTPVHRKIAVEPELMLEVSARVDARGDAISDFAEGELETLKALVDELAPESVAINLLFSFLNPDAELQLQRLFEAQYFVSRSSNILPEYREYERGVTTWINGWIGPLIQRYLRALSQELTPTPVYIMQSSGLTISSEQAANRAVNLLLSGPAGGLAAAQYIGQRIGRTQLITFDMGGTSTDVALLENHFTLTNNGHIAGMPIGIPMCDIHTIGAGGGSIAYIDAGGLLRVGPESSGAVPGPACYNQGGTKPTVTDANLFLGRLSAANKLADGLELNLSAAKAALQTLAVKLDQKVEEVAEGIIDIANEHMSQALRVISVQRGHDPRDFTLMCFGGAGGLHLCELAESLEIRAAVVPIHGGVLSALGMLTAKPGRELAQTLQTQIDSLASGVLMATLDELAQKGRRELAKEGVNNIARRDSLDLRYTGQTFTLNLPFEGDLTKIEAHFHDAHKKQYGHSIPRPVEILNCRVHLEGTEPAPELTLLDSPIESEPAKSMGIQVFSRRQLGFGRQATGPALVIEDHSTTYVKAGWRFTTDEFGNLLLDRMN